VQIARLFNPSEYAALNSEVFEQQYDLKTANTRAADRERKFNTTLARLAQVMSDETQGKLLDVGAGEGWSHGIAQHYGMEYCVVEAQPDLVRHLENRGATVVASSIESLLPSCSGLFKVILLRHTLEHLLDPIQTVGTLGKCLTYDGLLYVAVPSFTKGQPKSGFSTDFLRPVHISYFTANKLAYSLHMAGLQADIYDEGELWAIARPGTSAVDLKDERVATTARYNSLMREYRSQDISRIFQFIASYILHRVRKWNLR
jgi:2-polyprenyl-3-methyl-5-hydroxy-6-metoxy-1,4-benzoquinol methylase